MTVRIAMWSGPRNLSTALMRSFEARGDCAVSDEPLYAHYLAATGIEHPMRDEIIASQSTDWRVVVQDLRADHEQPIWYQKHMSHHLLPTMGTRWFDDLRHALLIRHPARVVASYSKKRADVRAEDLGFLQQVRILEELQARDRPVVVLDSDELLQAPAAMLTHLCAALGIRFTPRMLGWPAGARDSDGVWASHWYGAVHASTGFAAAPGPAPEVPDRYAHVVQALLPSWHRLRALRIRS